MVANRLSAEKLLQSAEMKLVSIGEASADYYPINQQTRVGGISLNFAVQAKRCGCPAVALVSRIGDDSNGQLILDKLAQEQIDARHVEIVAGKTAHCEIEVRDNGERFFPPDSYHQHVLADFVPGAAAIDFIATQDVIVCRYDISYSKEAFERIICDRSLVGTKIADFGDWFDYGDQIAKITPYLDFLDLAFISGDQATVAYFRPIAQHCKAQLVITLGDQGSVAFAAGDTIYQPAIPVANIIDSTGCGDAFQAAFSVDYLHHHDLASALHSGAVHASLTLQHLGAI